MASNGKRRSNLRGDYRPGRTILQAGEHYGELIDCIAALEKNVMDPALRLELKEVRTAAANAGSEIAAADQAIKLRVAAQQQIVAQIEPSIAARSGWIQLGKVAEHEATWAPGSPETVHPASAGIEAGMRLAIRDNVYLRGDTSSSARSSAAMLAIAKTGDIVETVNVDYSHAKGGGWFVWAKVTKT